MLIGLGLNIAKLKVKKRKVNTKINVVLVCNAIILKNGTMQRKRYKSLCLSIINLSYKQKSYYASYLNK